MKDPDLINCTFQLSVPASSHCSLSWFLNWSTLTLTRTKWEYSRYKLSLASSPAHGQEYLLTGSPSWQHCLKWCKMCLLMAVAIPVRVASYVCLHHLFESCTAGQHGLLDLVVKCLAILLEACPGLKARLLCCVIRINKCSFRVITNGWLRLATTPHCVCACSRCLKDKFCYYKDKTSHSWSKKSFILSEWNFDQVRRGSSSSSA